MPSLTSTIKLCLVFVILCCMIVSMNGQQDSSNIQIVDTVETKLIGSENVKISGKIMRELITNSIMDHFENVMFSPISLYHSLTLILEGCANNDPKRQELTSLLSRLNVGELKKSMHSIVEFSHESKMSDEKSRLILTPALFGSEEFLKKTNFNSDNLYLKNLLIQTCNFTTNQAAEESRKLINQIISDKNNETTTPLIGTGYVKNTTQAIYADTSLFVGLWEKPFELNETTIELFRIISSSDEDVVEFIEIEMMNQFNTTIAYGEFKKYHWISLKYKEGDYSMFLIVPKDIVSLHGDSEERFNRFVNSKLNSGCVSCSFPTSDKFFKKLSIPKFRFESKSRLSKLLRYKPFSIPSLFPKVETKKKVNSTKSTNETVVEPTPIVEETPEFWRFNDIFHKTILEFSELGTVEGDITPESAKIIEQKVEDESNFVLDRPFALILNHDPTNTPVYIGKVAVL